MAELTQDHKTVAKGAFWSLSGGLLFKLLGLVYTILLARLFAPSEVGIFYLGLGIVYLVGTMSDLGLNSSLRRYLPYFIGKGELKKAGRLASATYLTSGLLSLVFALFLFFLADPISEIFVQPELSPVLMILSLFLLINNLFGVNMVILGALMKIKETNILNNLFSLLKLPVTLLLFWYFGANAVIIAASITICYPIILAISFFYVKKSVRENSLQLELGNWKEKAPLLKEAIPLGLAIMLVAEISALAFYTDRIMLGLLVPPDISADYIGIYTMALSMALVMPLFPGAITGIFSPLIARLYGMGKTEELKKISRTSTRWNVFLLVPVAILMVVFSGEIMQLFYGAAYASGGIVLAILAMGVFFRYLGSVQGSILGAMRIVKIELLAAGTGLVLNVLLNYLLIPQYGMVGAAVAAALALLASAGILIFYCKRIIGSAFLGEVVVPVLAALVVFLLVFVVKEPLWETASGIVDQAIAPEGLAMLIAIKLLKAAVLGVILAAIYLVYFALLVSVKGIKGEDWSVLFASMRKAKVPERVVARFEGISKRFY